MKTMKTSKLLGFLIALLVIISVSSCGPTYYNTRNAGYSTRRHAGPPPRPYGGRRGYDHAHDRGYHRGW